MYFKHFRTGQLARRNDKTFFMVNTNQTLLNHSQVLLLTDMNQTLGAKESFWASFSTINLNSIITPNIYAINYLNLQELFTALKLFYLHVVFFHCITHSFIHTQHIALSFGVIRTILAQNHQILYTKEPLDYSLSNHVSYTQNH